MSESPFLPGTHRQWAWDSTSLGWLKSCPRQYQYSMIEGWRSRNTSVHLRFGIEYHHALETFDRLLSDKVEFETALQQIVHDALIRTWIADPEGETVGRPEQWDHNAKTRENLIRSIIWYVDEFRDDNAKTVELANGKPAVELSFRFDLDSDYVLCGHLDRLVEFAGSVFVMDRKTASTTLSPHYFDDYSPDNQMSLYTLASRVIYSAPVKGVIIDAAQIAVGFTRFERGLTYRTEEQLEEWITDTKFWLAQAESFADDGYWPQNDKSCRMCQFKKICSKDPRVRDKFLESDFIKNPWNPLAVR